jgi:hypothetical protein
MRCCRRARRGCAGCAAGGSHDGCGALRMQPGQRLPQAGDPARSQRVSMSAVRGGLCIWRKKTSPQCGEVFLFSLLFVHQPGGGRA